MLSCAKALPTTFHQSPCIFQNAIVCIFMIPAAASIQVYESCMQVASNLHMSIMQYAAACVQVQCRTHYVLCSYAAFIRVYESCIRPYCSLHAGKGACRLHTSLVWTWHNATLYSVISQELLKFKCIIMSVTELTRLIHMTHVTCSIKRTTWTYNDKNSQQQVLYTDGITHFFIQPNPT